LLLREDDFFASVRERVFFGKSDVVGAVPSFWLGLFGASTYALPIRALSCARLNFAR
jgi:hypothetical protein